MVRSVIAALMLFALGSEARKKEQVPQFVVDLDAAPEERFAAMAKEHKTYINTLLIYLKSHFKGDKFDEFLKAIVVSDEFKRELQGVADALGKPVEDMYYGEFYYELDKLNNLLSYADEFTGLGNAACTGVIAQNSNGTIYHGRNMDYPPPFSQVQYEASFQKNGKEVYKATSFAGTITFGGTCMVPGKFSVEINARGSTASGVTPDDFLADAKAGKPSPTDLMRQACTRGEDFESTVKFLSETPTLGTSNFYIIAGVKPGEGAVITRNSSGVATDIQYLAQGYPEGAPWYLLQPNSDRWDNRTHKAPLLPQIYGDDLRKKSGHMLMDALSPDTFGMDDLWNVMSDDGTSTVGSGHWGIYNQATIYTGLMIPATGEYHSYEGHQIISEVTV